MDVIIAIAICNTAVLKLHIFRARAAQEETLSRLRNSLTRLRLVDMFCIMPWYIYQLVYIGTVTATPTTKSFQRCPIGTAA